MSFIFHRPLKFLKEMVFVHIICLCLWVLSLINWDFLATVPPPKKTLGSLWVRFSVVFRFKEIILGAGDFIPKYVHR